MTAWWDNPHVAATLDADGAPVIIPGGRAAALRALQDRIAGYVPEWRDRSDEDAGVALTRLFGLQLDPILARANRLPEKALVEFLRVAGVTLSPPRSAKSIVTFKTADNADGPVPVPQGTCLTSARADGEAGTVTWETENSVIAVGVTLAEIQKFDGEIASALVVGEPFAPFVDSDIAGAAIYLGFEATAQTGNALSLAVLTEETGIPDPVAVGGIVPPTGSRTVTRWEALTPSGFVPVEVSADSTNGLKRMGILSLVLPRDWAADRTELLGEGDPLFWIRLRLASGRISDAPRIASLVPNAVAVTARKTFRDEFPVPDFSAETVTVQLSRTPVLPGSVVLEVDEGVTTGSLFDLADADEGRQSDNFRRWQEVPTLAGQRPDARVFTLDPATGVLTCGNNVEGMQIPPGIRNVAVRSYATTLGAAGNVGVDEISRLPTAVLGIDSATNPIRGAGGANAEAVDAAILRGPAIIKARGRAVSADDMSLLAITTEGADILKAFTLPGVDPSLGAATRPGTVGLYVLPRRHPQDAPDRPPVTTSETLTAVASYVANEVGPLGARIVAAAPRFHDVRLEASLLVKEGRDPSATDAAARGALDRFLNPEMSDWSLGATLRHADLLQAVLEASDDIVAVPFLAIAVDGIARAACEDVTLDRDALPWPVRHRLVVDVVEGAA